MDRLLSIVAILATLVSCVGCGSEPLQTAFVLEGNVADSDGRPLPAVLITQLGTSGLHQFYADSLGQFRLDLNAPGAHYLGVSAPNHKTALFPVYADAPRVERLQVRLAPFEREARPTPPTLIGPFNDWDREEGGIPLKLQEDGTYAAGVAALADTFAYQLVGLQSRNDPVAGTHANRYVYAGRSIAGRTGALFSVVDSPEDSVLITFDPRMLPSAEASDPLIAFADSLSRTSRVFKYDRELVVIRKQQADSLFAHLRSGGTVEEYEPILEDGRRRLRAMIKAEEDEDLRHHLMLKYFLTVYRPSDSTLAAQVFDEVPPSSTHWAYLWSGPSRTYTRIENALNDSLKSRRYTWRLIEENPFRTVVANMLEREVETAFYEMNLLENEHPRINQHGDVPSFGPHQRLSIAYDRLVTEFGDTPEAESIRKRYAPDRSVQPGNQAPGFSLVSLDDSTEVFTNESFFGRYLLIDFWAVWCGPCIGEMEFLHEAHKRYSDKGLSILSISLDERARHAREFRREDWPMPWSHAWLEEDFDNDLVRRYGVVGVPKLVLVDPEGVIIATKGDLRGENLLVTLGKVLGS